MNSRRISLDLLKGFEAAARHLSFTLAAKELCVTQSAISRQVKQLEEQCGQTLFLRINRGLQLTSAGQTLRDAFAEAQGLVHEAIDGLDNDTYASALVVASATPFASMVLAPGLSRFFAKSATTHLRILSSNEPAELDRMTSHVQIRHYAPGAAPAHAVWLAKDLVLPVCAPGLILLGPGEYALPAALAHQVLLRYETVVEGRTKIDWIRWLRANHQMQLQPRGVISFNHYDQLIGAAVNGCGIAMGRLPLVQRYLDSGSLIAPFGNTGIETGAWYALLSDEARMAHRQRELLQWLQSELATSQN